MHFDDELKITTNHDDIKAWARNRNGIPLRVSENDRKPGLGPIRIFFPEYEDKEEGWDEITWNEFLQQFEKQKLAMEFKNSEANGEMSMFYKFFHREKNRQTQPI